MKKLGLVVVTLGILLLSGAGFIFYTEGAAAFSTKMFEIDETRQITSKKEITIKSVATDVEVIPHDQEEITVELKGEVSEKMKDAYDLEIKETDSSINVVLERKKRAVFTVFAINKGVKLTVSVPETMLDALTIKTTSGDISVGEISTEQMQIDVTSGDVTLADMTATQAKVKSTSGDITMDEVSFDELNASATSGDITGLNLSGKDQLILEATSGDILLEEPEASFTLDFKGTSGDGEIDVDDFQFKEKSEKRIVGTKGEGTLLIKVRTASGDMEFK